jgi:carboxyl-terminal processing protease
MQGTPRRMRLFSGVGILAALILLTSCGGGGGNPGTCFGSPTVCNGGGAGGGGSTGNGGSGGGSGGGSNSGSDNNVLSSGIPSATVAGICDVGSQKQFIRSYLGEAYLWADEIAAVNSAPYTPAGYFYELLVTTPDAHGLPKDRFSGIITNADADTLDSGAGYFYGVDWATDAQGRTRVARIETGSPADLAGMSRGGELVSVTSSNQTSWFPNASGASISFVYRPADGSATRNITLTAAPFIENPVPLTSTVLSPNGRRVGYVLFNAHVTGAQDKLIAALGALAAGGIQDLVLDLRYNGGGFLYTALSLASMVTGPANDGKVFEHLQFNSRRTAAEPDYTYRFSGRVPYGEAQHAAGSPLPRLGLPRLYVLTTESTCSASESVVNGLRGIDVEVILVGSKTCGKPYGFSRKDNCGLSLFPIEFQGVNAKGFGDYAAGMAATCPAADDFEHALGNPAEGMLGVALRHVDQGACTPSTALARAQPAAASAPQTGGTAFTLRPKQPGRIVDPLSR